MTIYRNTVDSTASLYYPSGPTLTVNVLRNGVMVASGLSTSVEEGLHTVIIPFELTEYDADLILEWISGITTVRLSYEKVITPIVPLHYIANAAVNKTPAYNLEQISRIESIVRGIIESHTGQTFGLYLGTKEIKASGDPYLALPMPLLEHTSITNNGLAVVEYYGLRTTPDGWYLVRPRDYLEIKEAPPEEYIMYGVIFAPPTFGLGFHAGTYYGIAGKWGYRNVPEAVVRAAELLVDDFMCNEISYHDKYLTSISDATWKAQFSSLKYVGTGNARADMLLKPYVNISMVVI